jgi:hypothetical protein
MFAICYLFRYVIVSYRLFTCEMWAEETISFHVSDNGVAFLQSLRWLENEYVLKLVLLKLHSLNAWNINF